MKINGAITLLFSDEGMTIELYDNTASTIFVRVSLDKKQTCQALSRIAYTKCSSAEVFALDRIGKKHEHKKFVFEMPPHHWSNQKEIARDEVKRLCPEGWEPDTYFGSQGSFFRKDGKEYAATTIRKWVEVDDGKNG